MTGTEDQLTEQPNCEPIAQLRAPFMQSNNEPQPAQPQSALWLDDQEDSLAAVGGWSGDEYLRGQVDLNADLCCRPIHGPTDWQNVNEPIAEALFAREWGQ